MLHSLCQCVSCMGNGNWIMNHDQTTAEVSDFLTLVFILVNWDLFQTTLLCSSVFEKKKRKVTLHGKIQACAIVLCTVFVSCNVSCLVVGWEEMLVNVGSAGPVVSPWAALWKWMLQMRAGKHWEGFINDLRTETQVNIPLPICTFFHSCRCCGGRSEQCWGDRGIPA